MLSVKLAQRSRSNFPFLLQVRIASWSHVLEVRADPVCSIVVSGKSFIYACIGSHISTWGNALHLLVASSFETKSVLCVCEGLRRLTEGLQRLTEGLQKLMEGLRRLTEGLWRLTKGLQKLMHGTFTEAYRTFAEAHGKFTDNYGRFTEAYGWFMEAYGGFMEAFMEAYGRFTEAGGLQKVYVGS